MPAGRPSDYDPAYCEEIIELGKQGKSKAQIAAHFDVERKTLDNWAERHPEFLHAITRARELSLAWWEDQGQVGIWSKDFNANAYRLQVTNRFPAEWRDKTESHTTLSADNSIAGLLQRIAENGKPVYNPD